MRNLYPKQFQDIEQIIERSRHCEEAFLIDSHKATEDVLQYLTSEGMLVAKVVKIDIVKEVVDVAY